jgi:hypothetical protein
VTGDGPHRRGPLFWVSAGVGWAVIGFGLRGLFHHHVDTRPAELGRFLFGGLLAHDLVFAPLVLAAGIAFARAVPGRGRAPAQAALLISGLLALFAYPQVRNYARVLHNPTSLPHNYTANLAVVVAAVCCTTALVAVARTRRGR